MSAHVAIVGGGITGLAATHALALDRRARDLGVRCTLVEQESRLGGKLLTERINGCLVEAGPDSFLATKPWAANLCRALGLGDRLIGTLPGQPVYVAFRGKLHPFPEGLALGVPSRIAPLVRTRLLSPLEKLRVGFDLVLPRRHEATDETMGAFIRRRLGDAVVARLAGPMLAGIYAGDVYALSLRATFPQLLEWEASHRSLVLAAMARRKQMAAAASGSPSPMFLSLTGGVGELVEALVAALGGPRGSDNTRFVTGRSVVRLAPVVEHGRTSYALHLDDGGTIIADGVVLTVPAFASAALLAPVAPRVASLLEGIPYVSTAAVTLAFRRQEVGHPLVGHGFVVARDEPMEITACTWVSSKWPRRAPPDLVLLRCYLGAAGREAILQENDDRLVSLVRRDLRTTLCLDADPVFTTVARWPNSMPQYLSGHLDRLEAIGTELRAYPNLALAGAGYGGTGIPDCIRQGTDAAERLLGHISAQPASAPAR
ncbi:MAG: protoporphyrinogen oxidase [Armatimonadetes bacterium]|nr:protoporphyrinogen oxidase [Armatimonadota bacterium]